MGKLIPMSDHEKQRTARFNEGYEDATCETGCNLELYENDVNYRRGYDAGEGDIEELGGDFDTPTADEMKVIYGDPKDRV